MAKTAFATDNALTKKLWEEKLFRDTVKESYFMPRFAGKDSTSLVQVKEELTKTKGDKITFGIRMRLSGAGVTSGQTLEGNEEKLTTYSDDVSLELYRHAVRDDGSLTRQRAMFSITDESETAIKDWGAEKIDKLCFDALDTSPTAIFYTASGTLYKTATAATATAAITATDLLTPTIISRVRVWAKTGGGRAQTPLRPIKVNGKLYFVLLVHPDVMSDLKLDSTYAQAQREAEVRGSENPIFSGAAGIWDGVVVHEHENIPITTTWGAGSNVAGARCVLMGAQSLCWAWGKRPEVVMRDFDYGEEYGHAIKFMAGVVAPQFNSLRYGSIAVYVARTNISGIATS